MQITPTLYNTMWLGNEVAVLKGFYPTSSFGFLWKLDEIVCLTYQSRSKFSFSA